MICTSDDEHDYWNKDDFTKYPGLTQRPDVHDPRHFTRRSRDRGRLTRRLPPVSFTSARGLALDEVGRQVRQPSDAIDDISRQIRPTGASCGAACIVENGRFLCAPLAQRIRASDYGSEGRGFKSLRARQ